MTSKKIDSDKVWRAQMGALQALETNISLLEDATKNLKIKVASDKLNTNYSIHSDCLVYATKVWQSCLRLAELKKLQWELEGRDANGKLIRKTKDKAKTKRKSKKKPDVEV